METPLTVFTNQTSSYRSCYREVVQCKSTETCGAGLATSRKKEKKRYSYVSEVWASFSFASHMEKERLGVLILLHASQRSVDSINLLQDRDWDQIPPCYWLQSLSILCFQNFLIYMMFLLVILLTNYGDATRNSRAFLLQSSIKQQLGSSEFLHIKR